MVVAATAQISAEYETLPGDFAGALALTLTGHNRAAEFANFTNRYRHRDGSWRWLLWSARCDEDTWYAAAKDVTDRMWLERQALHDPLTKLPNRLLLMDRAHRARRRRSSADIRRRAPGRDAARLRHGRAAGR